MSLSTSAERVKWVDYAKGIAILLVIVGHTVTNPVIHGAIFSFHMPLFFILSGYTTKRADSAEVLKQRALKTFLQLIIPAYILWAIHMVILFVYGMAHYSAWQLSIAALFAGCVSYEICGVPIPSFGMSWFLVTLFLTRNLYSILDYYTNGKHMTSISIIMSACGVIIGQFMYLPFDFDIVMASMIFFHFGFLLKKFLCGGVLIFEYITCHFYLEMAPRRYPIFGFVGAIAGTMACVYVCIFLNKHLPDKFNEQMCLIGKQSITLFSIHYLDEVYYLLIYELFNPIILIAIRIPIDLIIFYVLYYLKNKDLVLKIRK